MICADAVDATRTLAATVMIIAASERTPRLFVNTDSLHILNSLQRDRGLLNKDLVQGVVNAFQRLMTTWRQQIDFQRIPRSRSTDGLRVTSIGSATYGTSVKTWNGPQ